MTLEELKAQHPALYAQVFNEGKEAGRKEEQDSIKLKINKAKNFVNSKEYPEPVVDMAVSVILGEKPVDILDVMVASADMFKELKKSQSVVAEQPVDTPADGPSTGTNEDGLIDSPESFMNQIKKDKGGNE